MYVSDLIWNLSTSKTHKHLYIPFLISHLTHRVRRTRLWQIYVHANLQSYRYKHTYMFQHINTYLPMNTTIICIYIYIYICCAKRRVQSTMSVSVLCHNDGLRYVRIVGCVLHVKMQLSSCPHYIYI